jgi:hypothetical protein
MVHCGYEPSAVAATFNSLRGLLATARLTLFGSKASDDLAVEPAPSALLPRGERELTIHTIALTDSKPAEESAAECYQAAAP